MPSTSFGAKLGGDHAIGLIAAFNGNEGLGTLSKHAQLLDELPQRELALQRPSVRASASKLDELLPDDFFEFSRSGGSYDKVQALNQLPMQSSNERIGAQDFSLESLCPDIALMRYRSFQQSESGEIEKYSSRSSLRQRSNKGRQLRFHQGTAIRTFAIEISHGQHSSE